MNIGLWLFNMYNEYTLIWNEYTKQPIPPAEQPIPPAFCNIYGIPYLLLLLVSSLINNNSSNILDGMNQISKQFYDRTINNHTE